MTGGIISIGPQIACLQEIFHKSNLFLVEIASYSVCSCNQETCISESLPSSTLSESFLFIDLQNSYLSGVIVII